MKKDDISALAVNNTIQIFFGEYHVNIQKENNPAMFGLVFDLIEQGKTDELRKRFFEIKEEIERYTNGNFVAANGALYLKGDDEPIPRVIATMLIKIRDGKEDFMPLVRFWKKLKNNPNPTVKEHLYSFMQHNNIAITPLGDVVCEKGVKELEDGRLVDQRTGTFDNSIGMVVKVDRSLVDTDPNNTCSTGLHVAAPEFVRSHWTSGVIIETEVSPENFVAIPKDYNQTKARVCEYRVLGLAKKEDRATVIYNFDDVISVPTFGDVENQKQRETFSASDATDNSSKPHDAVDLMKMSVQEIVKYVKHKTNKDITSDLSMKTLVVQEAEQILWFHKDDETKIKTIDVTGKTAREILSLIKEKTGKEINLKKPWRKDVVKKAIRIFTELGITLIDNPLK